ncbi:helix-turn-helix domain-containing protein [Bacillus sp. MRMR6]|uniref:helix-turn-helix domain-containing protein n=1 Tax=Bacillus sp. MRMR6 TaxID=1928617 RepID=UPI000951A35C|nr:helix-turn-helix domain-containing protein [Bacillus sp. MRMR6]OLS42193.1 hypothetical protein BTR25_02175 [Bacillus sp. MRMR6]
MANNPNYSVIDDTPTTPPGILVSDYYKNDSTYSVYRSSGTKDWLMIYTMSGKGGVRVDGQEFTCTAGTITLWPPGSVHDYYTCEGTTWEMVWCHFIPKPSWMEWLLSIPKEKAIFYAEIDDKSNQSAILNSFQKVIYYNLNLLNHFHQELAINALEETILLLANYTHSQNNSRKVLDPRIKEVIEFLTENYDKKIIISELAHHVSLSPSRLSHLYKEQVGESIIDTLTKIRLKKAEGLLTYTTRTINEISHETGFKTPDYFTRKFTEYYGENPSTYRKNFSAK